MKNRNILIYVLAVLLSMGSCKNKETSEKRTTNPTPVKVQKVQYILSHKTIFVSGNIEGNKTVRLGFLVDGKIKHISIDEGETINKGELLASLDPESYEIALEMADANFDQMQDDYDKVKELYVRKSASESDFTKVTNGLRVAKAQQRLHVKNLSDTKLVSPIKGVLLKKGVEEGEIISKGLQLFAISDIYKVKVNAAIPEMELHYLNMGDKANVYVPSLDSTFIGAIIEIGTLADPETRTFSVKISLQNPDLLIRPGMTAEIQIQTGISKKLLTIPIETILRDLDNSAYVFVVDTSKMQAFKRSVSLGRITNNNIEIISGLKSSEQVVSSGTQKLSNGSSIIL